MFGPINKRNLWLYLAPKSHKRKLLQTSWILIVACNTTYCKCNVKWIYDYQLDLTAWTFWTMHMSLVSIILKTKTKLNCRLFPLIWQDSSISFLKKLFIMQCEHHVTYTMHNLNISKICLCQFFQTQAFSPKTILIITRPWYRMLKIEEFIFQGFFCCFKGFYYGAKNRTPQWEQKNLTSLMAYL